jgi:hypothetical protein
MIARPKGADESAKALKQLSGLPTEQQDALIAEIQRTYGGVDSNPVLPPKEFDYKKYSELSSAEQARVSARHFFEDILVGNPAGMLEHCGFPFMLEDHRIDRPDDLRTVWQKAVRSHRTDLLKLYDLEVLTPQEMEKKYGALPRRLQAWNWRASGAGFFGVANLSGHATVVMLKQVGAAWQVIAFHD